MTAADGTAPITPPVRLWVDLDGGSTPVGERGSASHSPSNTGYPTANSYQIVSLTLSNERRPT